MSVGTKIVLTSREVELLVKKLSPDAQWTFGDAGVAEGVLGKLQGDRDGPPCDPDGRSVAEDLARMRRALERVRDYRPQGPLAEWSEAAALHEVQRVARRALLDPEVAAVQSQVEEKERVRLRRLVGRLRRGQLYLLDAAWRSTLWVRFVRGSNRHTWEDGMARVRVEPGQELPAGYAPGQEIDVRVENLRDP